MMTSSLLSTSTFVVIIIACYSIRLRYKFEHVPEEKGEEPQIVVYLSITPNKMLMKATPRHATPATQQQRSSDPS